MGLEKALSGRWRHPCELEPVRLKAGWSAPIRVSLLACFFIFISAGRARVAVGQGFELADLGLIGPNHSGSYHVVYAFNDAGQVVGEGDNGGGIHAFVLDEGLVVDLGTFGGDLSAAWDINNAAQVVGRSDTLVKGVARAFRWEGGAMADLSTLPGGLSATATAINDAGLITGFCVMLDGRTTFNRPFIWQDGVMTELDSPKCESSVAADINNAGEVVGWGYDGDGRRRALLWREGVVVDLGTLGGAEAEATAINNAGQVVGWAMTKLGVYHAFLWQEGQMTDLGTLGGTTSRAEAINDAGQVVGISQLSAGVEQHAFLYDPQAGLQDLNELVPRSTPWTIGQTHDINNHGQILVSAYREHAQRHFILDPAEADADGDGIEFLLDNCPDEANADQADEDDDGVGDVCDQCPADPDKSTPGVCGCGLPDDDVDQDGISDCIDNCPFVSNPDQADADGDGVGDACSDADIVNGDSARGGLCGTGLFALIPVMLLCLRALHNLTDDLDR